MKRRYPPPLKGNVEVSINLYHSNRYKVFIGGDPEGLRSLARMLKWLADVDQEETGVPDGEREHTHLHSGFELSGNSRETELCRLDAANTGEFPKDFVPKREV